MVSSIMRAAGIAAAISLMAVTGVSAQTPAANILVVDTVRVQETAAASKSMQTQVRAFEAQLQAQAKSAEEKLKAEEVGLKQQQTILSPEQFDVKRREFETKVGEEQRKLQQAQQDMQIAVRTAQNTMLKTLEPILKEIMTERGANLVVGRGMVLTSADNLDITPMVIERLDKRLPTVKVELVKKK